MTPYGFEQNLNERFRVSLLEYEKFIKEAKKDAREAEKEKEKYLILYEHER